MHASPAGQSGFSSTVPSQSSSSPLPSFFGSSQPQAFRRPVNSAITVVVESVTDLFDTTLVGGALILAHQAELNTVSTYAGLARDTDLAIAHDVFIDFAITVVVEAIAFFRRPSPEPSQINSPFRQTRKPALHVPELSVSGTRRHDHFIDVTIAIVIDSVTDFMPFSVTLITYIACLIIVGIGRWVG